MTLVANTKTTDAVFSDVRYYIVTSSPDGTVEAKISFNGSPIDEQVRILLDDVKNLSVRSYDK